MPQPDEGRLACGDAAETIIQETVFWVFGDVGVQRHPRPARDEAAGHDVLPCSAMPFAAAVTSGLSFQGAFNHE